MFMEMFLININLNSPILLSVERIFILSVIVIPDRSLILKYQIAHTTLGILIKYSHIMSLLMIINVPVTSFFASNNVNFKVCYPLYISAS